MKITQQEKEIFKNSFESFSSELEMNYINKIINAFNYEPKEIITIQREIDFLKQFFNHAPSLDIDDSHLPFLKAAINYKIRMKSNEIEDRCRTTVSGEVRTHIENEIKPISSFTNTAWYKTTEVYQIPTFSEFFNREKINSLLQQQLPNRIYDEKFQILQSPRLFIKDFRYFREVCEIRGNTICIAYIDIDDFKKFNSKFGETIVDKNILPVFMNKLESFTFLKGQAYRYGGDEYVVLLPNMNKIEAIQLLTRFQDELTKLNYIDLDQTENPTVSIGIFEVKSDCFLTENQIEHEACVLKNIAKKEGKNCIK